MSEEVGKNKYAQLLKERGDYVVTVEGVDWYDYNGFMVPAYLPHCVPEIHEDTARRVLRISNRLFARWDSRFGEVENSEWWYVLKRGPWAVENIKDKKKRWMIRQGKKHFSVRPLDFDEVITKCPEVAQLAAARYKGRTEVESEETLRKSIAAAKKVPGILEYIGCFYKDVLVSFSENYIHENGVWLANMRHDPDYLNQYSSYGFLNGILEYYLNQRKMDYVLDGCRSIHHRTHFQKHLIKVFGFIKEYAILNVKYSGKFGTAVKLAYPFKGIVCALSNKWTNCTLDNISAVLRQEYIRRACMWL